MPITEPVVAADVTLTATVVATVTAMKVAVTALKADGSVTTLIKELSLA